MMGFSSFGAQDRPQKKRRFNPNADAAVHTTSRQGKNPSQQSTGSNLTPLGDRTAQTAANTDEIDLDGDEDAGGTPGGGGATLEGAAAEGEGEGGIATVELNQAQHTVADTSHSHGLPQRPAQPAAATNQSKVPPPGRGHQANHRRDQLSSAPGSGTPWYESYYDTLSNRNPWEKIEKAMGLSAKGQWVSHEEEHAPVIA